MEHHRRPPGLEHRQGRGDLWRVVAKQQRHPPGRSVRALDDRAGQPVRGRVQLREARLPSGPGDRRVVGTKPGLLREGVRDGPFDRQRYTTCGRV
jgi:hypothetical protein